MTVFSDYAHIYDLLYHDKDYAAEVEYVHKLIQKIKPGATKLLNLGCGSGRHDRYLVEKGYSVTGVDISEKMLEYARSKAEKYPFGKPEYHHGDIRNFRLKETFEVIVSLFHVMSYQTANDDLLGAFNSARQHLEEDGILIFDCWYGPGVLEDKPTVRFKELENSTIKVSRIAVPEMHPEKNSVDVNYHIFVRQKSTGEVDEISETHRMRYLFTPEIELFLNLAGMKLTNSFSWMSHDSPDHRSWNTCFIAAPLCE